MMDHFRKVYWPGGMGLDHSAWWLVLVSHDGIDTTYRKLVQLSIVRK